MLRATFKRNLFPIALITLGGLIFLAIILYVFRAHLATVAWVLLGLLLIGAGVVGIVASNPKNKTRASDEASRSSSGGPGAPSLKAVPKYSAVGTREIRPGRQDTITVSKPLLIAVGVLFACLVLLLLVNVGAVLRSLLTVHKTHIIDCQEAARYAEDGWQFVSTYSYRSGDEFSGHTDHTDCVMTREQFVWTKDTRVPKDDASTEDTSMDDDSDISDPTPYVAPTQIIATQPVATQMPLPTATLVPASSPLPTWTLPPATPKPTPTFPLALPTAAPIPRTDIAVCEATSNATYLDIYVQWEGTIIDDPTLEDEGLWFQIQWTNSDTKSECPQATFFVSYDSDERFFAEDMVLVTGAIIDTIYEYEEESGQTEYAVVVRADNVELIDQP